MQYSEETDFIKFLSLILPFLALYVYIYVTIALSPSLSLYKVYICIYLLVFG